MTYHAAECVRIYLEGRLRGYERTLAGCERADALRPGRGHAEAATYNRHVCGAIRQMLNEIDMAVEGMGVPHVPQR